MIVLENPRSANLLRRCLGLHDVQCWCQLQQCPCIQDHSFLPDARLCDSTSHTLPIVRRCVEMSSPIIAQICSTPWPLLCLAFFATASRLSRTASNPICPAHMPTQPARLHYQCSSPKLDPTSPPAHPQTVLADRCGWKAGIYWVYAKTFCILLKCLDIRVRASVF